MEININTKSISKKGLGLLQIETDIPIYDKYRLTFNLNNGERKTIYLYTDKGTIDPNTPIEGNVKRFFIGFILENNYLKNDKIYLGSFNQKNNGKNLNDKYSSAKNGYESKQSQFDRLVEMLELLEAGEISRQEFEEEFKEDELYKKVQEDKKSFKEKVKAQSNPLPVKEGKHYALGDIHGHKKAYDTAMKQIGKNDSIVILGDVIDRGNDSIEILLDLINRGANTEKSNIKFIMGNHEAMMLDFINVVNKYHLTEEEIIEINGFGRLMRRLDNIRSVRDDETLAMEHREEARKNGLAILKSEQWNLYMEKYKEKDIFKNNDITKISTWFFDMNGGKKTYMKYRGLPEEKKSEIEKFLKQSYIAYNQTIKGQNKLYVHSRPPTNIEVIRRLKGKNNSGIRYSEVGRQDAFYLLWDRKVDTFTPCKDEGFTTICGHTYEGNTAIIDRKKGYTCLDEGCGHGFDTGLYCIEDGTISHINEMGEMDNKTGKIKVINENGKEELVTGTKIPQINEGR